MNAERFLKILAVELVAAAGLVAQSPPPVVLAIDITNAVIYAGDVSEPSKFATVTSMTSGATPNNFFPVIWIADIVAVNGKPSKGTWTVRGNYLNRSPNAAPGAAIADSSGAFFFDWTADLQQPDGTPIGSLFAIGTGGAPKAPGAPSSFLQANMTVVGGTGAYLGVRGQGGQGGNTVSPRVASISEDPSLRRTLGGGSRRYLFHLFPMFRPEVLVADNGPAVVHAIDSSRVTSANPAHVGEVLTVYASGFGPTRPGVDPGQPFPDSPLQPVNSPVEVTVNGNTAEVLYAGGYPRAIDRFQVNFRVPDGTPSGLATLRLLSGFVPSSDVSIPVQ
jgi:uncharacterized protein (TIGR03437 family)